jgi:sugar transferase EpsL
MKRAFDLLVIVLLSPIWVPVVALIGVAVFLAIGWPVLFTQPRAGYGMRPFRIVKFRTMTDARDSRGELLPDEQRLPPFGKFLRASSLDELPELWNVLRGEMSLVGPRPLLLEYVPLYSPEQARRHDALPGITGWAQVNGRNAIDWESRFALDVWYVDHRSIVVDARILGMTVAQVLGRKGISAPGEATMSRFTGNPKRS